MAVTEVRQLLVDFDQTVQERKGEAKERLIAIEHNEKSRAQGFRRKIAGALPKKHLVEFAEQVCPFIALGQAGFIQFSITLPELGRHSVGRVCFLSTPLLPESIAEERHAPQPLLDQAQERIALLRLDDR